jgi:hypothetical protein
VRSRRTVAPPPCCRGWPKPPCSSSWRRVRASPIALPVRRRQPHLGFLSHITRGKNKRNGLILCRPRAHRGSVARAATTAQYVYADHDGDLIRSAGRSAYIGRASSFEAWPTANSPSQATQVDVWHQTVPIGMPDRARGAPMSPSAPPAHLVHRVGAETFNSRCRDGTRSHAARCDVTPTSRNRRPTGAEARGRGGSRSARRMPDKTSMAKSLPSTHRPALRIWSKCPLPFATTSRDRAALPWGLVLYDACRSGQRPTPGLPHPAVQRLQVFSTS